VTFTVPALLVALALGTQPTNGRAPERPPSAQSLHAALAQRRAWQVPAPDARHGQAATAARFSGRVAVRGAARRGAAMKIGAGFVGALLGFYVGATVGGAVDCGGECYTGAMVGGSVGAAAGAVVAVLLVR
jgi:hypothetical protein